jgi:hypothetical protein
MHGFDWSIFGSNDESWGDTAGGMQLRLACCLGSQRTTFFSLAKSAHIAPFTHASPSCEQNPLPMTDWICVYAKQYGSHGN